MKASSPKPSRLDPSQVNAELVKLAARCSKDPLQYVQLAYPWRMAGGPLEGYDGPDKWQRDVLECVRDNLSRDKPLLIAVAGGNGPGKALAAGCPVLTPSGWVVIENIKLGDFVIAGDGTPTRVIGVYPQGVKQTYRVTLADGGSVVVDGDHLWLTESGAERKRKKPGRVRTTTQIRETLRFNNGSLDGCLNHRIPTADIIQHPTAILPVEPYTLGFWLGDGTRKGRVGVSLPEKVDALNAIAGSSRASPGRPNYFVAHIVRTRELRVLGLEGTKARTKFIPRVYLHGDPSQRTALLQGLLDTDGTCGADDNSVCYDTMSKRLADDVAELVFSLGGIARRGSKRAKIGDKDYGELHRVYISLPRGIAPFRLPAKANRYKPNWNHHNCANKRQRYIESVMDEGMAETICIAIDHPSKLYVTKDHIVTHNSATAAWIIDWAMTTCVDTRVTVTANTGTQLSTKTWPEVSKWNRMSMFRNWFDIVHRRLRSRDADHADSWRADAITWEENSSEAFQGLHNVGKRMVFVFDESSAIPPPIWDAQEGSLTDVDTEIIWLCLGNPTKSTGRFRECFAGGRHHRKWHTFQIDTRTAKMANQAQIKEWIETYGIEHDFVRVRVLSQFPNASSTQFIAGDLVDGAASPQRDPDVTIYDPLVIGVDVAAEGDDKSVIRFRRGRDARTIAPIKFRGLDLMQLAARVAELNEKYQPDAIFVDQGGVGLGVVDRLRQLQCPVFGVDFGANPDAGEIGAYYNKRAEMWGKMREWLAHGMVDDDPELKSDLIAVEYGYKQKQGRDAILLERKKDMKARGLSSPDDGDALALTFAHPVGPSDHTRQLQHRPRHAVEYDPFAGLFAETGRRR